MDWGKLILSLLLAQGAGAIGGFFTARKIPTWYKGLRKPWFNPPSWIFGPVWTLLYFLMGFSLYRIWILPADTPGRSLALAAFGVQWILNALWSFLFFGRQKPWWAFCEMIFLWFSILWTALEFLPLSTLAAGLLAPYLAWVSFALLLNLAIARANP